MLYKAAEKKLIRGLLCDFFEGGVVSLQYADDTLLFLDHSIHNVRNLKWILSCFEQISGTRINVHKSDLIPTNMQMNLSVT